MKERLKWLPALCWVAIICFLSFSSLEKIQVPSFFSADKIAHLGMYGILALLLYYPTKRSWKSYTISILFALIFSLCTELVQHYFVVNRSGEIGDFIANVFGLLVIYTFLRKKKLNK